MKERDCQGKKETHCQEAILGGHSSNEKLERAGLDCSFLSGSQWGTGTQYSSTQALTALPRSNPSSNYIPFLPEVTLSHTLHRKWYPSCITTFRPLKLFIQGRSTKTILPLTKSKSFISNPKRRDVLYYPPDLSDCVTTFALCLHIHRTGIWVPTQNLQHGGSRLVVFYAPCVLLFLRIWEEKSHKRGMDSNYPFILILKNSFEN